MVHSDSLQYTDAGQTCMLYSDVMLFADLKSTFNVGIFLLIFVDNVFDGFHVILIGNKANGFGRLMDS